MALSQARLTAAIVVNMTSRGLLPGVQTVALASAIAQSVIDELTGNAVVSPLGAPLPLTAPSGGGPVTGTGKVT